TEGIGRNVCDPLRCAPPLRRPRRNHARAVLRFPVGATVAEERRGEPERGSLDGLRSVELLVTPSHHRHRSKLPYRYCDARLPPRGLRSAASSVAFPLGPRPAFAPTARVHVLGRERLAR